MHSLETHSIRTNGIVGMKIPDIGLQRMGQSETVIYTYIMFWCIETKISSVHMVFVVGCWCERLFFVHITHSGHCLLVWRRRKKTANLILVIVVHRSSIIWLLWFIEELLIFFFAKIFNNCRSRKQSFICWLRAFGLENQSNEDCVQQR